MAASPRGEAVSATDGNNSQHTRAPHGVRPMLYDALRAEISPEYLGELVAQVKTLTRKMFVFCPQCRESVQIEVPDLPRVISGLTELLEQAEGKPGTIGVRTPA
jgi:hypothetical protein